MFYFCKWHVKATVLVLLLGSISKFCCLRFEWGLKMCKKKPVIKVLSTIQRPYQVLGLLRLKSSGGADWEKISDAPHPHIFPFPLHI